MRLNGTTRSLLLNSLLVVLISCFAACRQTAPAPLPAAAAFSAENLSYGEHARNHMDVRLPEGRSVETPFLILIHGGSWIGGDKSDLRFIQDSLFDEGIGSASINYRFVNSSTHYADLMDDVRKAVDFCVRNSDTWQIPATNYILAGVSAGGQIALLYAYAYNRDNRISGVISGCGPTDFTDTVWLEYASRFGLLYPIEWMTGSNYVPGQPLDAGFFSASPLYQAKKIPTLMIHGDQDLVVFYNQALKLRDTLEARGIDHKLVTIPGAGHDLGIANSSIRSGILKEMRDWCYSYGR